MLFNEENSLAMCKLHKLGLEMISHPLYLPDLAPATTGCSQVSKRIIQGKRFRPNDDVIAATEAFLRRKTSCFFNKK